MPEGRRSLEDLSRLQACGQSQLDPNSNVDARVLTREIQLVRVESAYRYGIGDYLIEQDLRDSTGSEVVHGAQRRGDADGPDLFTLVVRERQSVQGDLAGRRREWVRCREMNEARLQVPEAMQICGTVVRDGGATGEPRAPLRELVQGGMSDAFEAKKPAALTCPCSGFRHFFHQRQTETQFGCLESRDKSALSQRQQLE